MRKHKFRYQTCFSKNVNYIQSNVYNNSKWSTTRECVIVRKGLRKSTTNAFKYINKENDMILYTKTASALVKSPDSKSRGQEFIPH